MKLTKKQKRILIKNITIFSIKMLLGISLVYIDIVLVLLVFQKKFYIKREEKNGNSKKFKHTKSTTKKI